MRLVLIGANYKRTPLEWREALALTRSEREIVVPWFKEAESIQEVLILQTCHRVEFYLWMVGDEIPEQIRNWLVERIGVNWSGLSAGLEIAWDRAAVDHLFRVVAGLDSMVLGEEQILGQVREAYLAGIEMGGVSTYFHQLMSEALRVGKVVRARTGIARSGISLSTAAVEWVKGFGLDMGGLKTVVLGAGEMGQLALVSLFAAGVRDLVVINRSEALGLALAGRFGGTALPWTQKRAALRAADLVISSTSAPHYVITRDDLEGMERDSEHPLLLIDLAVPRDIEPEVGDYPGVRMCHLDALEEKAMQVSQSQSDVVAQALAIVEEEVEKFAHWLRVREAAPVIRALREKGEVIRREELAKAQAVLQKFNLREQRVIQEVTHRIVARLLHEPTVQLKELVRGGEKADCLQLICRLYHLPQQSGQEG